MKKKLYIAVVTIGTILSIVGFSLQVDAGIREKSIKVDTNLVNEDERRVILDSLHGVSLIFFGFLIMNIAIIVRAETNVFGS